MPDSDPRASQCTGVALGLAASLRRARPQPNLGSGRVLLDGRNRVRACEKAGVQPTSRTYTGDDPIAFALSLNLRRRHLTDDQRAMLAAVKLEPMYAEQAKQRQGARTDLDPNLVADRQQGSEWDRKAATQAAKAAGTSGRKVARAKKLLADNGELAEKVRVGDVPVVEAEKAKRVAAIAEQTSAPLDAGWTRAEPLCALLAGSRAARALHPRPTPCARQTSTLS